MTFPAKNCLKNHKKTFEPTNRNHETEVDKKVIRKPKFFEKLTKIFIQPSYDDPNDFDGEIHRARFVVQKINKKIEYFGKIDELVILN